MCFTDGVTQKYCNDISSRKCYPSGLLRAERDREHLGDFASAAETAGTATRGRQEGGGFHFRNERNVRSSE